MADKNDSASTTTFLPGAAPAQKIVGSAEVATSGEATITMIFPNDVVITLPGFKRVEFKKGIQEVPVSLADNEWLQRHGAKHYVPMPQNISEFQATDRHAEFLVSRGYKATENSVWAQGVVDRMSMTDRKSFLADFDHWNSEQSTQQTINTPTSQTSDDDGKSGKKKGTK